MLKQVYEESLNSAGSAMQEQERWANSLEAKSQKIEAIFESISTKVFDSKSLKTIFDGLANILELIDDIVGNGKGLNLLGGTIGGILGGSGNGVVNVNTIGSYWKNAALYIQDYNKTTAGSIELQRDFALRIQETNPALAKHMMNLNGAKTNVVKYGLSVAAAGVKTMAFKAILMGLNAIINSLVFMGIGALISKFSEAANENERLNDALSESSDQLKNNLTDLEDYKSKIDEIIESDESETEKLNELKEIKDDIHKKYQTEIDDINDATQAREALIDAIDRESKKQLEDYVNNSDNQAAYEEAKRRTNDNSVSYTAPEDMGLFDFAAWKQLLISGYQDLKDWWNKESKNEIGKFSFINPDDKLFISKDITDLFNNAYNDVVDGDNAFTFEIDYNGDEQEYFKKLSVIYEKFSDLRASRVGELTEDEEKLFQMVNYQYQQLKSGNNDFVNNIDQMANATARLLMAVNSQGDMNKQEYFTYLSSLTDDSYVIDALQNLIFKTNTLKTSLEETDPILADIVSNLQKIEETCSDVSTAIGEADEKFEKLTKTIEDNKDTSKFFSASDIIEILELYPELADSIQECAYGYKIEEEALETLRQTKLEEKKVALQTQLDEAQSLLNSTNAKLALYKNELDGISDVAKAKIKLAELEAQLAGINYNPSFVGATKEAVEYAKVQQEIAKYNEFVELSNTAEQAQQTIDKLGIELAVLGTTFDDAKDATSDATKALNEQKDSINELKDAYSDAKDAIEDLIKLTMDMIKKNKNLEKDALSEQLSNYKELISKKKELIDLEKENYEFSKKLKDQNKSLLQTQLELEALSVEGVNYSLEDQKRKLELEQELVEKQEDRTDLLYDHEVDVRKDALDKEQELFEKQINAQIKSIEDYLDKEGQIRADAIDLINGKSEQFYNDLMNYTMTYTDKSKTEFTNLWNKAYEAILTYANGTYDADLALSFLINSMELAEAQLKSIENAINNIQNATTAAKDAMNDYREVVTETANELNNLPTPTGTSQMSSSSAMYNDPRYSSGSYSNLYNSLLEKARKNTYHSGGIVEGVSSEHGEVLAKLLSGEVVVTENQARNFMENTLPKLTGNVTTNNSSIAPVINMGDINISGNADQTTVNQIKSIQKSIVEDVFKAINNQNNTFNGSRLRFI